MKWGKPVRIAGWGKYLPQAVPSAELEQRCGLPGGWSERYSGVKSRHHVTFENNGYMGARAVERALEDAGLELSAVDLLLSAAATYDYPLPNRASVIKSELQDGNCYTLSTVDIDSTCLSFVSAFEYAARLLDGSQYRTIVIVSSEISSLGLDPTNRETMTLFGDAAVAAVLVYDEESDSRFYKGGQRTWSAGVMDTVIRGGGNRYPYRDHPYDRQLHSFSMNGRNLLRLAMQCLPEFMDWFFSGLPLNLSEVDAVVPHQASKLGIQLFRSLFPLREDMVKESLAQYGNCIAASIPLTLCDAISEGSIRRGDTCLLFGTSAGFSIGAVLMKY
jgi:3-oxoacyl-[acyl-carrier-protein] synthase-3